MCCRALMPHAVQSLWVVWPILHSDIDQDGCQCGDSFGSCTPFIGGVTFHAAQSHPHGYKQGCAQQTSASQSLSQHYQPSSHLCRSTVFSRSTVSELHVVALNGGRCNNRVEHATLWQTPAQRGTLWHCCGLELRLGEAAICLHTVSTLSTQSSLGEQRWPNFVMLKATVYHASWMTCQDESHSTGLSRNAWQVVWRKMLRNQINAFSFMPWLVNPQLQC